MKRCEVLKVIESALPYADPPVWPEGWICVLCDLGDAADLPAGSPVWYGEKIGFTWGDTGSVLVPPGDDEALHKNAQRYVWLRESANNPSANWAICSFREDEMEWDPRPARLVDKEIDEVLEYDRAAHCAAADPTE